MLDQTINKPAQKCLYSFLLVGISREVTRDLLLSYLRSIVNVVGIRFLDMQSVEVVVMRLSDCIGLITVPLYISGCRLQAIPYLYLGKKVEHTMSQQGRSLTFQFNPECIVLESLIEYVSNSTSSEILKISDPKKISGNNYLVDVSFEFSSPEDTDFLLSSTGYSGHAYDLPIAWLHYDTGFKGILE